MKNLILFLCLFALGLNAQNIQVMTKSATTMVNTTAVTATLQTNSVCENVSIQAVVTKSTGTVAGTVAVSASLDGTNYVALTSSTLALTDIATNTAIFPLTGNPYLYYRVTFTGSGTMVATPSASLLTAGSSNKHTVLTFTNGATTTQTTTNSGSSTLTLPLTLWYNTVTIQSVITKVSGTVGGTATLQGSIDGTNFVTVSSAYADVTSYTPTDQTTNSKLFIVTGSPYRYYRISYTGTGTMVATQKAYILPNKK